MRNATAYGASPRLRLDVVLNNLVAWAHTTGRIRLKVTARRGARSSMFGHLPGRLALLEAPAALVHGEAFNVGSGDQNFRISDLANTCTRLPQWRSRWPRRHTGSAKLSGRLRQVGAGVPGCRCEWTAELGAEELVGAYQTVGLSFQDFQEAGR